VLFSRLSYSFLTGISICVLIFACSQSLYIPAAGTVADESMIEELTVGRKLYIKQCGSCHNLYTPQTFSNEKWSEEMVEMKKEAKISDQEAELILKYLTGFKETPE